MYRRYIYEEITTAILLPNLVLIDYEVVGRRRMNTYYDFNLYEY